MATKADFTEEEWKTLQKGVTGAGMLVSAGDRDFTDSFGEAGALAKYLGSERENSESPLIRELASVRGSGFGFTDSAQEVEEETLAAPALRVRNARREGARRGSRLPPARLGRS